METGLTLQYPAWFIILCLLLGALYSFALYYRQRNFNEPSAQLQRILYALAVARFIVVSVIAFLLLSPFIKSRKTETEKPIIIVALDNSESIRLTFENPEDSLEYINKIEALHNELQEEYDVQTYTFGDVLNENHTLTFQAKSTDISGSLKEIQELYNNQNVGAVILASDGIFNQGFNPLYGNINFDAPLYTVALGDTTVKKDIKLDKVLYNKIAYLDDKFQVKVDYSANNLEGQNTVVSLYHIRAGEGSKRLEQKEISIGADAFNGSVEFIVEASSPGLQHYQAIIHEIAGEATIINNRKDFFVDVLDNKQKILMIAHAPHPDLTAIKQSIERTRNYEIEIVLAEDIGNKAIREYNLVILHQLPSIKNNIQALIENLKNEKTSILYILGSQSSVPAFNEAQSTLQITQRNISMNETQAVLNKDFPLFTYSDKVQNNISVFPPLKVPYGNYEVAGQAKVLLKQKIGAVETDYPLIAFSELLGEKQAVLVGEGIWRWRLFDFMQNGNHETFDELINKMVQYLALRADKRQFRIVLEKNIFSENEEIEMDAELYNDSYELINTPEVSIVITDEEGKEYPFNFNKTANAYSLNAGFLGVGNYTYTASTNYNGKRYTASGEFSVSPLQLEALQTTANHQLLYLLSQKFGGELVYPENLNTLSQELLDNENIKPVLYSTFQTQAIINLKWLFFLIVLLLSAEWFSRKYFGAY